MDDMPIGAILDLPTTDICRDLVIPKRGTPTYAGGKPFPFYIAEDGIESIEPIGGGFSKVTLTILAQGVTVKGGS